MLKMYVAAREAVIGLARNEEGASLAEYALLIALVLIGAVAAINLLTGAINGALGRGTAALDAAV